MILYDIALFLFALIAAPRAALRYRRLPFFRSKLGSPLPTPPAGRPVAWIHGASVGEIKSASSLFPRLRARLRDHYFLITTSTFTGRDEAIRSLPGADHYAILPFDFSFVIRRWVRRLAPTHFFAIEGDAGYHLLTFLKEQGAFTALLSASLSERSFKRLRLFPRVAGALFSRYDAIGAQDDAVLSRLKTLCPSHPRLTVTKNLKLDAAPQPAPAFPPLSGWGEGPFLTLASTHPPEERLLIAHLFPLLPLCRLFLAPRHLEEIPSLLRQFPDARLWSAGPSPDARLILVDRFGCLPMCYRLSSLAIVGGSFTPAGRGHNIFEPLLYSTPAVFGPYMSAQQPLVRAVLEAQAGLQLPLPELSPSLLPLLQDRSLLEIYRSRARAAVAAHAGATEHTLDFLAASLPQPTQNRALNRNR